MQTLLSSETPVSRLSVLGPHEICHRLGLALEVMLTICIGVGVVVVVVAVSIVSWADVFHLVDASALGAALDRAVARGGEPEDNVRVHGNTGAADVLLVTEGLDNDRVVHGACAAIVSKSEAGRRTIGKHYPCGWHPEASCRRYQRLASFRGFPNAQDQWPARGR